MKGGIMFFYRYFIPLGFDKYFIPLGFDKYIIPLGFEDITITKLYFLYYRHFKM